MSDKPQRPRTAADVFAELESDPSEKARVEADERERQKRRALWSKVQEPIVQDLRGKGLEVDSVWDLVNTSTPYPEALPILLRHLDEPYPDRVREGIARALAVPDASFAWPVILRLYRREPKDTDAKQGLAVALAATADRSTIPELVELLQDSSHGESRGLLLSALARHGGKQVRPTIEALTDNPDIGPEATIVLKRFGGASSRP